MPCTNRFDENAQNASIFSIGFVTQRPQNFYRKCHSESTLKMFEVFIQIAPFSTSKRRKKQIDEQSKDGLSEKINHLHATIVLVLLLLFCLNPKQIKKKKSNRCESYDLTYFALKPGKCNKSIRNFRFRNLCFFILF